MKVKKNTNRNIDRKRVWDISELPRKFRRHAMREMCAEQNLKYGTKDEKTGKIVRPFFVKGCAVFSIRRGNTRKDVFYQKEYSC